MSWRHLAALIACALAVFVLTFSAAMIGFGLGVTGGFAPSS